MYRPRLIPILILENDVLVKTVQFKNPTYIGDPINAVKLLSNFGADEIVLLDITAGKENRLPNLSLVREISEETNIPLSVGGGIQKKEDIEKILRTGADKVILRSHALIKPDIIPSAAAHFGTSTIGVCVNFSKNWLNTYRCEKNVWNIKDPIDLALKFQELGAGEILFQDVNREGTFKGYDTMFYYQITNRFKIPIVAAGGARKLGDIQELHEKFELNGYCASSIFLYHGTEKGVLIQYPNQTEKIKLFNKRLS